MGTCFVVCVNVENLRTTWTNCSKYAIQIFENPTELGFEHVIPIQKAQDLYFKL